MPEFHEEDWVTITCVECSYIVGYYEFDGEPRGEVVCEDCFHRMMRAAEADGENE